MVYIATHKKFDVPPVEGYTPIQVGAELHDNLGYLTDNTGDNISIKNPNYCELTALYWIWKNTNDEYVGLAHYRRYFVKDKEDIVSDLVLKTFLKGNDIVLPKKWYFKKSVGEHYSYMHKTDDLKKCRDIIKKKYPEYLDAFNEVMSRRYSYLFNMFYMKRELFTNYMEWLFDIFSELEPMINIEEYDDYNKRVYGFLSERLFNVWICKNKLKIKECEFWITEESKKEKFIRKTKNIIKKILSFL